jgi:hypothetical protein
MIDNIERVERQYNREELEAMHDQDLRDMHEGEYQRAVNAACHAIRMMPLSAVTSEAISQILSTLANAATVAELDDIADILDIASDEVKA